MSIKELLGGRVIVFLLTLFLAIPAFAAFDINSRIDFTSERDADLGEAFAYLTQISKGEIQFFFDSDVKLNTKFQLNQKDMRFIDTLKLILQLSILDMNKISDSVYFVYPQDKAKLYEDAETKTYIISQPNIQNVIKTITKLYPEGVTIDANAEINSLSVRAKKSILKDIESILQDMEDSYKRTKEEEASKSGKTEKFYFINYADAAQIVNALNAYFPIDKYVTDAKTNSFYIMYSTARKEKIEEMIKTLDVPAEQVKIEVSIIDKAVGDKENFGLKWDLKGAISEKTFTTVDGIKQLVMPSSFDFSKLTSSANILANPTLTITNRKESKILVGEKIPVIIGQPSSQNSAMLVPTVDYKEVGLVLKCTPIIHQETGDVTLDINLTVNNLGEKVASTYGEYFRILTKEILSTVRLKDGEQLIFGGLISNEDRKKVVTFPILGNIPILGDIFKNTETTPTKTEIILIIKPTLLNKKVVLAPSDIVPLKTEENKNKEENKEQPKKGENNEKN